MSEQKHTPGEWSVEIVKGSYKRPAYVKCGEKIIAHCIGDQLEPSATSIREAEANARLIAAAPEMLDALKALTSNLGEGEFISLTRLDAARAAIAKAEGRP